MSPDWAMATVRDYVCSSCWGHVLAWPQPDSNLVEVLCHSCGVETRGFVSKYFVDERRQQDHFDAYEVARLLQDLGVIERPPQRSPEQILEELGF